ncbi:MAG: hypothetical protein QNJ97_15905 [Myxococcota bacterium]|nr:hypothetical protein [Myxococcota bacterium]
MLQIIVEARRTFNLRQAVIAAVEGGDYDSLYDDILDCFTDDQVEQMEEFLDSGDVGEAIDEIVTEWNAEDVDELFESIESYFADSNIEIQFLQDDSFDEESDESDYDMYDEDEAEPDAEAEEPEGEFEPDDEEEY